MTTLWLTRIQSHLHQTRHAKTSPAPWPCANA